VRYRSFGLVGWLFFLSLALAAGAFVYLAYLPLRQESARLRELEASQRERSTDLDRQLQSAREQVSDLTRKQVEVAVQLERTVAEKAKLEDELKAVQAELTKKLDVEIQSGNIELRRRGDELVVDVADQVLFQSGQADVTEAGQKVLEQVSQSLAELAQYAIQVGGHTDSARVVNKETQARFPTNWELSTARATNVVRFLQERGKIPGERLVASGFAQFRPAASNKTAQGRQRNRRIELVLVPLKNTP
jgi:chemotaxis protein MotB